MRAEILAVGTELLLGQIIDTNSATIAEKLAIAGIDCNYQTRVGDNVERIVAALSAALDRADAVVICGGLGPTQDDVTREAIAAVMGVELVRRADVLGEVEAIFARRGRHMTANNARQADVPEGASVINQSIGTAPGLICPFGAKVMYALPGVPDELEEMLERAVLPDLRRCSGELSTIASRTLRTWGHGESRLAELVSSHYDELESAHGEGPTIAFLASGIEGIKLRVTVKAADAEAARRVLDEEERRLRAVLGDAVFGIDDETMEYAVGEALVASGMTLAVAESFTGGLLAARIVAVPGASRFFAGGLVAYESRIKVGLLGVPDGPVVTIEAAAAMAGGVRRLFGTDIGLSTTGVAGPDPQEEKAPGTGFAGLAFAKEEPEAFELRLAGSRRRIRELATINSLDLLRRRLRSG